MAKKKNEETEDLTPAAIELTIRREHVDFPHSIQLRRNGGEHVVEARTADFRHTENVGAKTVEAILRESGAALPETADDEITLTFSPYNGEIMAITPVQTVKSEQISTIKTDNTANVHDEQPAN